MEIVTGYRGKPHITSEKWADLNRGIIGTEEYVLGVGRMFESELVSNNLLKIYDGCGVMQGRQFGTQAGQSDEITIENGTQGEKRIDLIVARYTKNEDTKVETIEPVIIKGTPSASDPAVPKHTEGDIRQGDLIADMPLYEVELNGINVVEVRPLFQVLMNMNKINKYLSDILRNSILKPIENSFLMPYQNRCKITSEAVYVSNIEVDFKIDLTMQYTINVANEQIVAVITDDRYKPKTIKQFPIIEYAYASLSTLLVYPNGNISIYIPKGGAIQNGFANNQQLSFRGSYPI